MSSALVRPLWWVGDSGGLPLSSVPYVYKWCERLCTLCATRHGDVETALAGVEPILRRQRGD